MSASSNLRVLHRAVCPAVFGDVDGGAVVRGRRAAGAAGVGRRGAAAALQQPERQQVARHGAQAQAGPREAETHPRTSYESPTIESMALPNFTTHRRSRLFRRPAE